MTNVRSQKEIGEQTYVIAQNKRQLIWIPDETGTNYRPIKFKYESGHPVYKLPIGTTKIAFVDNKKMKNLSKHTKEIQFGDDAYFGHFKKIGNPKE